MRFLALDGYCLKILRKLWFTIFQVVFLKLCSKRCFRHMLPLLLPFSILKSKITFSNGTWFIFYSFTSGKKDLSRNIFFIFLMSQKLECIDLQKQKMIKT